MSSASGRARPSRGRGVDAVSGPPSVPDVWLEVMRLDDGGRVEFLARPRGGSDRDALPGETMYRVCRPDGSVDELPSLRAVAQTLAARGPLA